jgi:hypothetical protein
MDNGKVKKVTILKKDLPPVNSDNQYAIRYRIVSDDKNRVSHWSPVYLLDATEPATTSANITKTTSYNGTDVTITVTWTDISGAKSYDVFTRSYFTTTHKELLSNVATITTLNDSGVSVGDTITVSGIDATFDGVHVVTATSPAAKTISYAVTAPDVNNTVANGLVMAGYVFHGSTPIHTYSFIANPNASQLDIALQIESIENIRSEAIEIFETTTPVTL